MGPPPGTELHSRVADEAGPTPPKRRRRWLGWLGVAAMGLVAVGSSMLSANLRDHADDRRMLMDELTQLEVQATAHSMSVWRALTMLMAGEKMQFIRLRGEVQGERQAMGARLDRLVELDQSRLALNGWIDFEAEPAVMESLKVTTMGFLGSVQGAMGQLNLSVDRVRERLRYWDMNFGPFQTSLQKAKERNGRIAEASALVAKRVTTAAGLARLLASVMLFVTLSRLRSRVQDPSSHAHGDVDRGVDPSGVPDGDESVDFTLAANEIQSQ